MIPTSVTWLKTGCLALVLERDFFSVTSFLHIYVLYCSTSQTDLNSVSADHIEEDQHQVLGSAFMCHPGF